MKAYILNLLAVLLGASLTAHGADRFVSTVGAVDREVSADRVRLTIRVKAVEPTPEASAAALEKLLAGLQAEAARLKYPTNAFSTLSRATEKEWEWEEHKKKFVGIASTALLAVKLVDLQNYAQLLTFLGLNDGYEVAWVSLSSSAEGPARRQAVTEALEAARSKAELLAASGGARLGPLLEVTEEEGDSSMSYYRYANRVDPNEGKGVYPINISVRVRAKFELMTR